MKKSIFEFDDKFGVESPFGDWLIDSNDAIKSSPRILVSELIGPNNVCSGGNYEFIILKFNQENVDLFKVVSLVKWGYSITDGFIIPINAVGKINHSTGKISLNWTIPKTVQASEYIKVYAWLEEPSEKVFASALILKYPFLYHKYKEKGKAQDLVSIADDMCYGDGINKTDNFRYTLEEIEELGVLMKATLKMNTPTLWVIYRNMIGTYFTSAFYQKLKNIAFSMVQRFQSNVGGEFSNENLNIEVFQYESTKLFINRVEEGLKKDLQQNKGNPVFLNDINTYKSSERFGRPIFHTVGDILTGLTIMINDTWAFEIFVTDFLSDGKKYQLKYKIILYDHFGLDKPDVEKKYYYIEGFRAWFVLQHHRSFKPFITKMESSERTIFGQIQQSQL